MKKLNRYLCTEILKAILGATLGMLGVMAFILFVNELDAIGDDRYGLAQAFYFVLLQMPQLIYQFFPMIALMGSLFALGDLAEKNELTVMRASGLSILQLSFYVIQAALVLICLVSFLGETVVPKLSHMSVIYKENARHANKNKEKSSGVWTRIGSDFIYVEKIVNTARLEGISVFHLENNRCTRSIQAAFADRKDDAWTLHQGKETRRVGDRIETVTWEKMPWPVSLNAKILDASRFTPNEMTFGELKRFIHSQEQNHVAAGHYELAYWERLFQPISTAVMMLLAIPFVFGSLRSTSMGARLVLGVVIGFTFYMMNRFVGPISLVFQFPPFWAAVSPTLFFAGCALILITRFRI